MQVHRRSFLLGLGSAVALASAPAVARPFIAPVSTAPLQPAVRWRQVCEIIIGSEYGPGEVPVHDHVIQYHIKRNDQRIFMRALNWRSSYRWSAVPGDEIILSEDATLGFDIEPATTHTSICIVSNIERNPDLPRKYLSEQFEWWNGELKHSYANLLAPEPPEPEIESKTWIQKLSPFSWWR